MMLFILLLKDAAFPHASHSSSLEYARAFLGSSGGWDVGPKTQNLHIVYLVLWVLCFKVEIAEDGEVSGDEQGFCSICPFFLSLSESFFPLSGFPILYGAEYGFMQMSSDISSM
jgi:hypothetical protein